LYTKCNNLKEIWINGGEPTLIREHGYFLEKFIEDGTCANIDLHYSINMTAVPDRFIEIWKKFKRVRIHLSIDDLEGRNEYIRYGSNWETTLFNFKKIIQYKDIFNLEVCQTVSAYNVYNIDNFKKFTLDYDLIISHNYVHYPSFQHVNIIPEEMKIEIINNIKYMRPDEIERLKIELFKPTTEKEKTKFFDFVKILDKSRNTKITDHLMEWKKYIE
jgi:hypothetical protein